MVDIIDTTPRSPLNFIDVCEIINQLSQSSGNYVIKTGDTMEGDLLQPLAPSQPHSLTNKLYVDTVTSGGAGQIERFIFVAAGGNKTISGADGNGKVLSYTPSNTDVFVNGKILAFSDFTATDGTSITIPSLVDGDIVLVKAYGLFAVALALNKNENLADVPDIQLARMNLGINATNTPFSPLSTIIATNVQAAITELNTKKINKSGDTFTGNFNVYSQNNTGFVYGNSTQPISYTSYPVGLRGDTGIAFLNSGNQVKGYIDSVNGILDMAGDIKINGRSVYHAGNFDPTVFYSSSGGVLNGNMTINSNDASVTLKDITGASYKIHTSVNASTLQIRFSFYNTNGNYIDTPTYFDQYGNIWSKAFGNDYITNYFYHKGNFSPNDKVNKSGDTMTGNLSINHNNPTFSLSRVGSKTWYMNTNSDGTFRIYDTANRFIIDNSGNVYSVGNLGAFSDRKIKKNISPIENPLEKLAQLEGVEYTRKDTHEDQIGLIAQEVEKVFPQLVMSVNAGEELGEIKTVAYGNFVGVLVAGINALTKRVEELERQIEGK